MGSVADLLVVNILAILWTEGIGGRFLDRTFLTMGTLRLFTVGALTATGRSKEKSPDIINNTPHQGHAKDEDKEYEK